MSTINTVSIKKCKLAKELQYDTVGRKMRTIEHTEEDVNSITSVSHEFSYDEEDSYYDYYDSESDDKYYSRDSRKHFNS